MAVLASITTQYAKAVYRDHTRTFESVPLSYKQAVMEYAAHNYYIETIQGALDAGTITQEQYDGTLALKVAGDPENSPDGLPQ
jgi:hypothetical protein